MHRPAAMDGDTFDARRALLRGGLALPLVSLCGSVLAQDKFPAHPMTFVLALAPGGAGDFIARRVTRKMSERMGQPVVIENRPGAGAVAAALRVKQSPPDGYTWFLSGNGTAVTMELYRRLPYSLKDFRSVSTLAFFDLALIADGKSKFNTVKDVLEFAKANPGKLSIGCLRIGSTQHLAAEMLTSMSGIQAVIVPYKSTGEMLTAIRAGDVQVAMEIVPPILGQIKSKQVKGLAVAGANRFPELPDVPTVMESGIPGFEATSWCSISVPVETPDAVVQYLQKEVEIAVAAPDVQRDLQAQGYVGRSSTPQQMDERLQQDMAKWKAVIDKAGVPRQ